MATFKNDTGESRDFPLYGLYVAAGETFEVPDDEATSIEGQPGFTRSIATSPRGFSAGANRGKLAGMDWHPTPKDDVWRRAHLAMLDAWAKTHGYAVTSARTPSLCRRASSQSVTGSTC